MRFSAKYKASALCAPSPDGRLVAAVLPSGIHVRDVGHLDEVANVVPLPPELPAAAVVTLQWSPSSQRVLVATPDRILVAAALPSEDGAAARPIRAQITNPSLPLVVDKLLFVGFGVDDDHVWVCSAFGIKFSIFDLTTARATEVLNPKFFKPTAASRRGFAFRLASRHLALLTRTAGKDWVSVHDPASFKPIASWAPSTVDAQGLLWSPDGHWLVVWESQVYGHKVVFYTPEGHLFKTWTGGGSSTSGNPAENGEQGGPDAGAPGTDESPTAPQSLEPGVSLVKFSADGRMLAVGDASRCVRVIGMPSIATSKQLVHPTTLTPHHASLGVWQEQIDLPAAHGAVGASHTFVEAVQTVSPPGRAVPAGAAPAALPSGCSLLAFDCSSTLLATRFEDAPSTIWVWDLESTRLCTVMMLHASVSGAVWHPEAPQTLLITSDGDKHRGVAVVWSPLLGPPQVADFSQYHPAASGDGQPPSASSLAGKHRLSWLALAGHPPALFYADGNAFMLTAFDADSRCEGASQAPWPAAAAPSLAQSWSAAPAWTAGERARDESPLELVPAGVGIDEGDSELEDTFHYKRDD